MARVVEGAKGVVRKYGGTDLDRQVRVAVHNARSLRVTLAKAEEHLRKTIEIKTAEIERLQEQFTKADALAKKLIEEKQMSEPGTVVVGISRPGKPIEMSNEEWHRLRKEGKHLEHLRKAY